MKRKREREKESKKQKDRDKEIVNGMVKKYDKPIRIRKCDEIEKY